ncbi:MAG TPA: ATP synthase F1 subunit gamma [Polyangiaceae bacterium]|jgi:F-type H+-transporting ATPase subunit gamma|nr:ATP synthase F1 subunit gamma [Polyangiaceae bacterium]
MANLKAIRKRISTVKSTQKITRAMKMVAGARLSRAQQRITAMRPYAQQVSEMLSEVVRAIGANSLEHPHPLLARREEKRVLFLVISSDRGLCGAFNTNINKRAEALWKAKLAEGVEVKFATVGRRARDYFRRRSAPSFQDFDGVWEDLNLAQARRIARTLLAPFLSGEVDAIYLIYNEFKSAMTQQVISRTLLPLSEVPAAPESDAEPAPEYIFEPNQGSLFETLVPMYIEITLLRALYDSVAAELGARMTAMDSATKNASDMIASLTLRYNRQRQAVITTELIEIIAGSEALQS